MNNQCFSIESSNNEEFLTPDLLRLAGIQYSSPDDGYETNSSPILNSNSDSRFFPMSKNRCNFDQVRNIFIYKLIRQYIFLYMYIFVLE